MWLPQRAEDYFKEKFPKALPFLPKLRTVACPLMARRRKSSPTSWQLSDARDEWLRGLKGIIGAKGFVVVALTQVSGGKRLKPGISHPALRGCAANSA